MESSNFTIATLGQKHTSNSFYTSEICVRNIIHSFIVKINV